MAKPPDGSSAWFHNSDSHSLLAADGSPWALVTSEVAASRLSVSFAILESPGSFFSGLQLEGVDTNVKWTLHHESLDEQRTVTWRPALYGSVATTPTSLP